MYYIGRRWRLRFLFFVTICCLLYLLSKHLTSSQVELPSSAHSAVCEHHYPHVNSLDICATFIMPKKQSYFIALNLYNNDPILDALKAEILRLVLALRTCTKTAEYVFVSIYESGSTDGTPVSLERFGSVLKKYQIPHHIVTRGKWTRKAIQPRIEHLSKIRNAVLQPLYNQPRNTYTQIIFLNDVLFCAEDVLTLIQSQVQTKSLLHCGFDYVTENYRHQNGTWLPYVKFYDFWVGRDRHGQQLKNMLYPWYNGNDSQSVEQILDGHYRIPSFCCWNGLAILSAMPFYDYEYRWRFGQQDVNHDDCASGEMGYLCEDLWALYGNQTRIYINPSVHVAYDWKTYSAIKSAHWFERSLTKQIAFQKQLREHPILEPPDTVLVPKQWQCVTLAGSISKPFTYLWKDVRILAEHEKVPFIRLVLAYRNEWVQASAKEN